MNTFYPLLKVFSRMRSPWVKHVGVLAFYLARKRYLGLFLDPTQACNLKCRMCYFSGESHKLADRSQLSLDDYKCMADAMFHRVLRLQIGCGAEPTLYRSLPELVRLGKERGIPNISLTTNGNLLDEEKLEELACAGLDELILSVHGLTQPTYEYFMQHGRFSRFLSLLDAIKAVKKRHPGLQLRINYTVNEDNVEELELFPKIFEGLRVNVLQVRPVQNLGDSDYKNFRLDKVKQCYDKVFGLLKEYAGQHDTLLIIPSKANIDALTAPREVSRRLKSNEHIQDLTHVYGRPGFLWRPDFDFHTDTFEKYCRRNGYFREIMSGVLPFVKCTPKDTYVTEPLNYTVK